MLFRLRRPSASLRLFKKAHGVGSSHLPPRRAGESPPHRRTAQPGATRTCPAAGSTHGRPEPRRASCRALALTGALSAGEGTEPCQCSAPGVPQVSCSPPASLSVRLGFSISIRFLLGFGASPGTSLQSSLDAAALAPSRAWGQPGAGCSRAAAVMESPTPCKTPLYPQVKWGPVCSEHHRGDTVLGAGKGQCDHSWCRCPGWVRGCGSLNLGA